MPGAGGHLAGYHQVTTPAYNDPCDRTEQPAVGADEPGPVKRQGSAEPAAPVPEPTPVPV
jgi:hypothetical protein